MKSIKQIRELQVQLSENVESAGDVRKLTTLVRAGLFDPNKLTMLKRALNKDNVKMTRAERDALLELLDRLLTVVMANQSTFMKVKQSIQEELSPEHDGEFSMARSDLKTAISSAQRILDKLNGEGKLEAWLQSKITLASDYLSSAANYVDSGEAELKEEYEEYDIENLDEATRTDVDINQIPPIIIMKRRAIRVFPDGQKVALYWADRINKYISVPFQSIGISEAKEEDDDNKDSNTVGKYRLGLGKLSSQRLSQDQRQGIKSSAENRRKTLQRGALRGAADIARQGGWAAGAGAFAGLIGYNRSQKKKIYKKAAAMRRGAVKAADQKRMDAAMAGAGHAESFKQKLALIREQNQVNEWAPLVAAAARVAPMALRAGGALLRSRAGKAAIGAVTRGARKLRVFGKRTLPRGLKKAAKSAGSAALDAATAAGSRGNDGAGSQSTNIRVQRPDSPAFKGSAIRSGSSIENARQRAANVNLAREQQESYKNIKSIAEGTESKELKFADGAVELSPSVAGKIVETYNALNTDNKKIVLEMINKDKNSFMKFANFASGK